MQRSGQRFARSRLKSRPQADPSSGAGRFLWSWAATELPALDVPGSVSVKLPFVPTYAAGDEWAVLADRTRRAIVECLADRPWAVGELAEELPVSRPAVSQHLKVLKDAGLVIEHAAGTRRIYRLNPIAVGALRDQLDAFWNRALAGYEDVVKEQTEEMP